MGGGEKGNILVCPELHQCHAFNTPVCWTQTVLPSRQLWDSPWCGADAISEPELSGHSLEVSSLGTLDSQTLDAHTELSLSARSVLTMTWAMRNWVQEWPYGDTWDWCRIWTPGRDINHENWMLAGPSELTTIKGPSEIEPLLPQHVTPAHSCKWEAHLPRCHCCHLYAGAPGQLQFEAVDHEPNLLPSLSFCSQALVRQLYYRVPLSQRGNDLFWVTPKVNGGDDWKDMELGLLPDTQWRCQRILDRAQEGGKVIPSPAELSACSPLLLPEGASPGFRGQNSKGQLGFLRWTLG